MRAKRAYPDERSWASQNIMILIYSTFSDKKEAQKIGRQLVEKRLAACVNAFPIRSIYRWKGKVVEESEIAMIAKTEKRKFKEVENFILRHHSYSTPCIIAIPLGRITRKYHKWLQSNLG